MSLDDINYVEFSPSMKSMGEVPSTRLREETFKKTDQAWKKYLLEDNYKKIEDVQKELNEIKVDDKNPEKVEDKVLEKTTIIARLEATIKYINKEDIPSNFVSNRAIKLKNDWLENVKANSAEAYKKPEEIPFVQPEENNIINDSDITNFVDKAFEEKIEEKNVNEIKDEIINEANKVEKDNEQELVKEEDRTKELAERVSNLIDKLYPESEKTAPVLEETFEEPIPQVEESEPAIKEESITIPEIEEVPVPQQEFTFDNNEGYEDEEDLGVKTAEEVVESKQYTFVDQNDDDEDEIEIDEEKVDNVEPIDMGVAVVSPEGQENINSNMLSIEELVKLITDDEKNLEATEAEKVKALQEKEEAERKNAEIAAEKQAKEESLRNALQRKRENIRTAKEKLDSDIQNIKEETENVNKDIEIKNEAIAKLIEIESMVEEKPVVSEEGIQKTM